MGVVTFDRRLAQQPRGIPRINRKSPFAKGLVFCAYPVGSTFFDLVTRTYGVPTSGVTPGLKPRNDGFSGGSKSAFTVASTVTTDQVAWPASSQLRGGTAIQQGTILCLGGITEKVATKQYFFGSSMNVDGSGMSVRISSGLTGSAGSVMRGKSSTTAIGWSSSMLGSTPGLATHFFGYTYNANGANGKWLAARTHEDWTGGTVFGTGNTNRKALLFTDYDTGNYTDKKSYIALFMIWDRELSIGEYQALYDNPWLILEDPARHVVLPIAAGGGTVHDVDLTEAFSSTDSASSARTQAASSSEAATVADTIAAVSAAVAALIEAASATDVQAAVNARVAALTEAASAADTQTAARVQAAAATEAAGTSDAQTAALTAAGSVTEPASASDLVAAVALAVAAVSEAISATDAQSTSPIVTAALSEAASATDSASVIATLAAALSESAAASDAIAAAALLVSTLAESVNAADAATTAAQLVALLTESASLADVQSSGTATVHNVSIDELALALDLVAAAIADAIPGTPRYTITARPRRLQLTAAHRRLEIDR